MTTGAGIAARWFWTMAVCMDLVLGRGTTRRSHPRCGGDTGQTAALGAGMRPPAVRLRRTRGYGYKPGCLERDDSGRSAGCGGSVLTVEGRPASSGSTCSSPVGSSSRTSTAPPAAIWRAAISAASREGNSLDGDSAPRSATAQRSPCGNTVISGMTMTYPIVLDNEYEIWRSFANRYWPALYLVDGEGR